MSVDSSRSLMDRYFAAMGADENFSGFFEQDVSWRMVDTDQEVRGPAAVRDYILELHRRMHGGDQGPLVVADGHALLEGEGVDAGPGNGPGLTYCLVYDLGEDRISAVRCYGSLARLMTDPT